MCGVGGVILASGIGIRQKSVPRKRLDGEGVGGVKIQVLFKTVGVEEIIADPALLQWRQFLRIEVELDAFTGTKHYEAVVRCAQETTHIAVTGVVAGGSRVRAGFAASRVGVAGVARGCETLFERKAQKSERRGCEGNFGDVYITRVWRLIDPNGVP